MAGSRKFWLGMALGALAGGVISLFDKATRHSVKEDFKKVSGSVTYIVKHPDEFIGEVKETVNKVRTTVEQVSEDVSFIAEKVEEIKDVPPQVAGIVHETKEVFGNMAQAEEDKNKQ
ncbi:YtxH domain-containing protein [Bacillus sp. B15-48]|uniref:YtxH domain-containing protein n=1 Tax=Bacillus sp. B15-48 TaxID=1548601 RepID=UPI00193FEA0D|nr:YtxH domain-containing protein [Bacillus sp. B15-48]MBM4764440.1 YtxH domain-containing protein [Bacillus sp. B15-48]